MEIQVPQKPNSSPSSPSCFPSSSPFPLCSASPAPFSPLHSPSPVPLSSSLSFSTSSSPHLLLLPILCVYNPHICISAFPIDLKACKYNVRRQKRMKIFIKYALNKSLISRAYKEFKKLSNKTITLKWKTNVKKSVSQNKQKWIADTRIKTCTGLLAILEM